MHSYDVLDNIQHNLEEKGIPKGAYLCSYPTFRGIYHHLARMLERSGQSIYLMLCTIVDSKGRPMKEGAMLEGLAKRLEESICTSIRNSDVVNHYSKGQYLVLLINTTREDCAVIQKRINYKFLTDRQRTGVRYYVNSVVYWVKNYSACGTQAGWFFCYNITTYSDICDSLKKSKKNRKKYLLF